MVHSAPVPQDFCDTVMKEIHASNLDFLVQESPYSLYVTIRKKFAKNLPSRLTKHGNQTVEIFKPELESSKEAFKLHKNKLDESDALLLLESAKCKTLKEELKQLKASLEDKIDTLVVKLEAAEEEIDDLRSIHADANNNAEVKNENTKLKAQLTEQVQELSDLKSINMNYKKSARVLDNDLAKTREKARLELTESKKILKKEIKYWRKELGEERKFKIQLENILKESNELVKLHLSSIAVPTFQTGGSSPEQDSVELSLSQDNKSATFPQEQITCVICTEPVSNYVPKYVLGE